MTHRILFAALAAVLPLAAQAQDQGLYPKPSAPDAAFLRVVVPGGGAVAIGGKTVEPDAAGLTPYVEVAPGPVEVSVGSVTGTVEAQPNAHYSYVVKDGQGFPLTDGVTGSPAQADLLVYNLTDLPSVDVFVPSADTMALKGVASDQAASVALRAPLTLDLEIRDGDEAVAEVAGVELVRSAATSVILAGASGAYTATSETSTYDQ